MIIETFDIKIAKAREEMSPESRAAIDAVSWRLILSGINKKYTPDQLENLEIETELLLCGLITTEDYPKELEARMRLHKAEVGMLIDEIDKLIFKKIQEELEKRLVQKEKDGPTKVNRFVPDPRFISLPKSVQEAIYFSSWKEKIYEISQKYKINIEQTGILEDITRKTLLGVIKNEAYEGELKSKIGLPDDKNKEMVTLLNERVFQTIKELMKNSSKTGKVPPPPYKKIITNDEPASPHDNSGADGLGINNVKEKREIPKPLTPINTKNIEIEEEKPTIKEYGGDHVDPYKEHGIEILSDSDINGIKLELKKEEVKKPETKPLVNIMMDKLTNSTSSKTVVSDYSLPKMNNQASSSFMQTEGPNTEKPHDPYHEAF